MSADTLVQGVTDAIYLLIALVSIVEVLRRPRRANLDIALFFGVAAVAIIIATATAALGLHGTPILEPLVSVLIMLLPYLLLRLVDDFLGAPRWLSAGAAAGLALLIAAIIFFAPKLPSWLVALLVLYFVLLEVYGAAAFSRAASRAAGVTRRRLQAVAAGSFLLGLALLSAALPLAFPADAGAWALISRACALFSGVSYYLGFATPAVLRRAWQEPELRAFLNHAASLPHLPDIATIAQALERDVALALGGADVIVGLYDEEADTLRFRARSGGAFLVAPGETMAGRTFQQQRPLLSLDAARDDPANAELYARSGARAVLAAPITSGSRRLGVLMSYVPRPPLFADDDLTLLHLLAQQASIILDYALLYETAHLRAQEIQALYQEAKRTEAEREQLIREQAARAEAEAAVRARDEFLSIAAHELKTPVTSLRGFAQLLLRQQAQGTVTNPERLQRALAVIDQQSLKINRLVAQLLDLSRLDLGRLALEPQRIDLAALAAGVLETVQQGAQRHALRLEASGAVPATVDPLRLEQVLVNLVDNAIKYSPDGGAVEVRVAPLAADAVQVSVRDHGVGIPEDQRARIFDRFYQAHANGHLSGMGLGLYITRQIVELHGGQIAAEAPPGGGARFVVTLPAGTSPPDPSPHGEGS